jgi:H+-transporting ATPase
MMYLLLSVAGHLTIFQTRTRGAWWTVRPARILVLAVVGTQILATGIGLFGFLVTPLWWGWAALVWGYALCWFLVTDPIKLLAYRYLDATKKAASRRQLEPAAVPAKAAKTAPGKADEAKASPARAQDAGSVPAKAIEPSPTKVEEGEAGPAKPDDARAAPPAAPDRVPATAEPAGDAPRPRAESPLDMKLGDLLAAGLARDPEDAGRLIAAGLAQTQSRATPAKAEAPAAPVDGPQRAGE